MTREEDADDVTFVDLHDALQDMNVDEDVVEDVVTLPPPHRCASHTANLIHAVMWTSGYSQGQT